MKNAGKYDIFSGVMSELLAPAGNIEALNAAIGEGADAVYLGLKSFNARLRASNFAWNQFEAAVQSLHKIGKKIYVTVNTVIEESETERLYRFLEYLNRVKPDGIIVQDFAIARMCSEFFPEIELHASTQMNAQSAAAVNLLGKSGFKRVVVARELGFEEIKKIKETTSCEIEMFVHGALCISESGLCLFSSWLGGKSANRGLCAQACRRFYTAETSEGEKKGYYFSPADLQLIEKIPALCEIGVDSFKIEGRMKSAEYVGSVVAAYRYLIDHWREDKKGAIAAAKRMLATDFARTKTEYWYNFKTPQEGVLKAANAILNPNQPGGTGIYLGKIAAVKSDDSDSDAILAALQGGNYDPEVGDSVRLHKHDDSGRESHKIRAIKIDENETRWIDIPRGFSRGDDVYLLQTKSMSKRYSRVLPADLKKFRAQPRDCVLPILDLTPVNRSKNELSYFPEGIYVQISTIADLFTAQTVNPVRYILELNFETKKDLTEKHVALPISKKQMIISLDPFCPQDSTDELKTVLECLITDGFQNFIINNIAHIAILKNKSADNRLNLIAGPYLYTFNRWAVSWLENQNIGAFITPLENSFENLRATFKTSVRDRVAVTIYAYPSLFRMRFQLPESYDFLYFKDKEETQFKALSNPDGTFVMPENPFSIADKTNALRLEGFSRVLIDFSKTKVTKREAKLIISAMQKGQPLPDCSRFNWKDGFYDPEKIEAYKAAAEKNRLAQLEHFARKNKGAKHKEPYHDDFNNKNKIVKKRNLFLNERKR